MELSKCHVLGKNTVDPWLFENNVAQTEKQIKKYKTIVVYLRGSGANKWGFEAAVQPTPAFRLDQLQFHN